MVLRDNGTHHVGGEGESPLVLLDIINLNYNIKRCLSLLISQLALAVDLCVIFPIKARPYCISLYTLYSLF